MRPDEIFQKVKKLGRKNLTELESREILKQYKIPVVESYVTKKLEDAINYAEKIGYPVVLKIISPSIVHKTEAGAYALNIKNKNELESAYRQILLNVRRFDSSVVIHGMLVQKMVEGGMEVIVGGKIDSQFGQTIMFGLGGIMVEAFDDVSFRVCPITKKDAEEMIKEIKGYKILKSYRGKTYDMGAVVDILLKTSKLLEENSEIEELDINPIIVLSEGAVAVDSRIVIK